MIPHERKLVERPRDKAFKLISVSVDDTRDVLTKFLAKEKMPWVHMWNGAKGGLVDHYQIESYPTIYILDAKGIIRFKHVRYEEMDQAVDTLLNKMGA
jgi:hypothetical protein